MIGIFQYFFGKRSEIQDLDFRDALLAQANVRIYRTRTHKTLEMVPLKHLKLLHSLERENSKNVLAQRIAEIEKNKEDIIINNEIKMDVLNGFLPSISSLKVVEANRLNYLAFEGNGRIAALKEVFGDSEEVFVEVEHYHFKNKKDIVRKLNRIRKVNGMI